jgi:DNA-binding transcriptional ArsR family regulator
MANLLSKRAGSPAGQNFRCVHITHALRGANAVPTRCACTTVDSVHKIHNYSVVDSLTTIFTALSDPTRRAILERLALGEASVLELAEPFAMSQQAVSKHLAYLERAELIRKRREGRQHFCALEARSLDQVTSWVEKTRAFWNESFDRLECLAREIHKREKQVEARPRARPQKEEKRRGGTRKG